MPPQTPVLPCPRCDSTRFAHVPALIVLAPFVSAVRHTVEQHERAADRRVGRSGEALVCLGCGHVDFFLPSFASILQQPGVTEVRAPSAGPYR